jgi:environmental stress-induced protein Ves
MSVVHIVRTADIAPQAWRNGGGVTRELLAWPIGAEPWMLRVSVADIEADGPFSAFLGVERWFCVISGAGVVLQFAEGERRLTQNDPPLRFDGAAAPGCRLIKGATRDLNLMLRGGHGSLHAVDAGIGWAAEAPLRALFTAVAGRWADDSETHDLPAQTLLWCDSGTATTWTFDADTGPDIGPLCAWWIACTPGARG